MIERAGVGVAILVVVGAGVAYVVIRRRAEHAA